MSDANTTENRVRLGELAAALDDQLALTLALYLGRGTDQVLTLLNDVLWRVPIEARIRQLDEALHRTNMHDRVPALTESLTSVFWIRNLLAHSIELGRDDAAVELFNIRSGKRRRVHLTHDHLSWAVKRAVTCQIVYFPRIEGRIGDAETWGQLYGFDER